MLISVALGDILGYSSMTSALSFLCVFVISGQSACLIIVLTVPYLASDMVWLIMQYSHSHVGQVLRDALSLFSL